MLNILGVFIFVLLGPTVAQLSTSRTINQNVSTGQLVVIAVDWSSDGSKLAIAGVRVGDSFTTYLRIVDLTTEQSILHFEGDPGGYTDVEWSPDGARVAVAGFDAGIQVIDVIRKSVVALLTGHRGTVSEVSWSPDGMNLISAGTFDRRAILWDVVNYVQVAQMETADPWSVAFRPDGVVIAVGGEAGVEIVPSNLDVPDFAGRRSFRYEIANVGAMVWSSDYETLAVGSQTLGTGKASIQFLNTSTGAVTGLIRLDRENIHGIDWSGETALLAVSSNEGTIQVIDGTSLTVIEAYEGTDIYPTHLSFSPYGGRLAFGLRVPAERAARAATLEDVGVAVVVPAPSVDRVNTIAALCMRDSPTRAQIDTVSAPDAIPAFIAQVEALPEGAIPPACKADLLAVARAVVESE